jgi:Tol biopolymer transport system component
VPVGVPEADYRTPSLSPDGRRVAVSAGAAPAEIWVADLERGTRLLLAPSSGTAPIWSHDGKRVIYAGASGDVMTVPADGSGAPEVLLARQGATNLAPTAAAPDGSFVVANAEDRSAARGSRNRDIWIVRPGQKPLAVVATPADDRGGVVSPDGRWLAYSSSISGREEIYIRPVAGGGATIPVSTQGGTLPRWPRMDTLYFLGSRTLMRVPIALDPLRPGTPVEAVELPRTMGGIDIDTNGRVLIIEAKATATGTRDALHVLLNWGRSLR